MAEMQVGGLTPDAYDEITRATGTTQYTANDHITEATARLLRFHACRKANGSGLITGGRIIKSTDTITAANLRLWLFAAAPFATASIAADNAAITFTYASMARFVGYIDFATWIDAGSMSLSIGLPARSAMPFSKANVRDGTDSSADQLAVKGVPQVPAAYLLYGMLQDKGGYTPADSEQFRIWLDVQAD